MAEISKTVTVIVCTFNRSSYLLQTLESLALSSMPQGVDWEVLVVDNNSTDSTRQVVEGFCEKHKDRFHYLCEPASGKSHALNTGLRVAKGEIIAFTDDDVIVQPDWLQNLTGNLDDQGFSGAGGKTLPYGDFVLPDWLSIEEPYNLGPILYAAFDLGDSPKELERPPYGVNMAFTRKMFAKYGIFRTDMGPQGGNSSLLASEDTDFGSRILKAGEKLRYQPNAIVRHHVFAQRLNKKNFLKKFYRYGRSSIAQLEERPDIFGIPRRYFTMAKFLTVVLPGHASDWLLARGPQKRFYMRCLVWRTFGQISEFYKTKFRNRSQTQPAGASERRPAA